MTVLMTGLKGSAIGILLVGMAEICLAAPSYESVCQAHRPSEVVLRDRHGEVVHELRMDDDRRKLEWVALPHTSSALIKAVIGSEDRRFYRHSGVDWQALGSAAMYNLLGNSRRGASTITMQLASLLEDKGASKKRRKSIGQKWEQMRTAREIEKSWSKDQILEAYLNLVSFRGELQGIAAAARGIFDKDPSGLDGAESAILAALIRSPNASPEKVGVRAQRLAESLGSGMRPGDIKQLAMDRLSKPYSLRKRIDLAPHVARRLMYEGKGIAQSTLDSLIQRFAIETLRQAVAMLAKQNVKDGAALVADNHTGDILAYVGNIGGGSSAFYVDGAQSRRQAGSTLKTFLYGLAIEKQIITAASLIEDSPLDLPTERGVYRPENYDKDFRGLVSARTALASSLNVPAVRTLNLLGVSEFAAKLAEFGFGSLMDSEFYGPSLALGSADVTLWELVSAYRTLANGGLRSELRLSPQEKSHDPKRVLSREAAFIISSILSDREARSATFSLESPLSTRFWAAAKTGTSKDMRDNWCVGYSERYTVGVWVGNFSGAPMWNVSGVSGAAPVWLDIMNFLHRERTSRPPAAPSGLVKRSVRFITEDRPVRSEEWFIQGTERETVQSGDATDQPRIVYPGLDTLIAIDPDIPLEVQRVFFESSSPAKWILDGQVLGTFSLREWRPLPGKHELFLETPSGIRVDRIAFEVR